MQILHGKRLFKYQLECMLVHNELRLVSCWKFQVNTLARRQRRRRHGAAYYWLPRYSDVYSQRRQTRPAQTAASGTTQSWNRSIATWTPGSKHHRRSETPGSLSGYSQRRRAWGRAYRNTREVGKSNGNRTNKLYGHYGCCCFLNHLHQRHRLPGLNTFPVDEGEDG